MGLLDIDVPPTYVPGAQISICGEKPGREEGEWQVCPRCDRGGTVGVCSYCQLPTSLRPESFVGKAGRGLAQMCGNAGIVAYNKTNVVKCIDGGFTSDEFRRHFYETVEIAGVTKTGRPSKRTRRVVRPTAQLEIWIDRLRAELLANPANVVVAAGSEALYALTGLTGIENYRGSILESSLVPGQKVIPIIHPAALYHSKRWEYYYVTIADLKRAQRESLSANYRPIEYPTCIWPTWGDVTSFIGMAMNPGVRWCLDLETRAESIACIGLSMGMGPGDISTLCIPLQTTTKPYWTPAEESEVYRLLALLMRRNPNLVGQNLFAFDLDWLLDYGCEPSGVYMDTMSAFALCYPELPKRLDFISSLYGSLPYYKFEAKTWNKAIPDEQLFTYNSKDTFTTLEISFALDAELKTANLDWLYRDYVLPVHWMALEIQRRKIPVNLVDREAARQVVLNELKIVEQDRISMLKKYEPAFVKLDVRNTDREVLTADNFNVRSPYQMQNLVFGVMKLPARHKRGSSALTADEESLMDLIAYYPEKTDDLKLLMKEKHLRKALDYVEYKIEIGDPTRPMEGILSFSVNFPGTESFRFSMSKSPRGYGFNAQTPPTWSRFQYIPPVGRVFISRDLSQVEARAVAGLAQCRLQLERFSDPTWSIHRELGKAIYGNVPDKGTPQYTAAKSGVHGGNFREGPLKMARSTGAPLRDTKLAVGGYHRTYPEIRLWHDVVRRAVINKGQLVNPFGFRRIFYKACGHLALQGVLDDSEWNEACSAVPQSVPPFIINQAVVRCMEALPWVWFHHQGHDSYLASVPRGRVVEADNFLRDALDIPVKFNRAEIRVPSEPQVGYTWGEMMPLGDKEPTHDEWETWCEGQAAQGKGRCKENIIKGINGIL